MKLQDIDFGVGFRNQIRMGVKSKNGMIPKSIDITERFERVMLDYLLAIKENNETLCFYLTNKDTAKKRYEVILKEVE